MAVVTISGILKSPDNSSPAINAKIEFRTVTNSELVLIGSYGSVTTSETGSYSIDVNYGLYSVWVTYQRDTDSITPARAVNVAPRLYLSSAISNGDLNDVIQQYLLWAVNENFRGEWNSGSTYSVNDTVVKAGELYYSLQDNNKNQDPVSASAYWNSVDFPGSGTTNYISKWVSPTTQGNSVIYDDGVNVGIGTSSPSAKLDVNGNIKVKNDVSNVGEIVLRDSIYSTYGAISANNLNMYTNQDIAITSEGGIIKFGSGSGANERMRIDSSGNVGIGKTPALGTLDVNGSIALSDNLLLSETTAGTYRMRLKETTSNNEVGITHLSNTVGALQSFVSGVGWGTTFSWSQTVNTNYVPLKLQSYTVGTVPNASTVGAGSMIYVSNESGGQVPAFSDGTNWLRFTDRAVIS